MKQIIKPIATMIAMVSMLSFGSCSNEEEAMTFSPEKSNQQGVDFVAEFTPQQEAALIETGNPYGEVAQKDSWTSAISADIPTYWGMFELPEYANTRAAGIYGSYPAQYWTMLRVKLLHLPQNIKDGAIMAIEQIENTTNVRFYNSIEDEEYYEPGHIKLPNISVHMNESAVEGSGSYGLIGGEQFINVPAALKSESDDEIRRFFLHAFCNAAGMFNEQQRKDRDDYVTINLNNVKSNCKSAFTKITKNYTMQGSFDYFSITLAASTDYSNGSGNTIMKTGNYSIAKTYSLSYNDIYFLNGRYLPYIARTDNYIELDDTYYPNGQKLTEAERLQLQTQLNNQRGLYGEPPLSGRATLIEW